MEGSAGFETKLFDISINIVLTFEFCNDFTIWKIFDSVDYIELEPALTKVDATKMI